MENDKGVRLVFIEEEYYVEYYAQGMLFRKKAGVSKEEAEKLLKEISKSAGPEHYFHKGFQNTTLDEFLDKYIEYLYGAFSERTIKRMKSVVQAFCTFIKEEFPQCLRVCDVTPQMIDVFLLVQSQNNSTGNTNNQKILQLYILSDFFILAINDNDRTDDPTVYLRAHMPFEGKALMYLKEDEQQVLLEKADQKTQAVILILLETGMLFKELMRISWDMVDIEEGRLHISNQRILPLSPQIKEIFQKIKRNGDNRWVFQRQLYQDTEVKINKLLKNCFPEKNGNILVLRHTFAHQLFQKNVRWMKVAQLMGINDIKQALPYVCFDRSLNFFNKY